MNTYTLSTLNKKSLSQLVNLATTQVKNLSSAYWQLSRMIDSATSKERADRYTIEQFAKSIGISRSNANKMKIAYTFAISHGYDYDENPQDYSFSVWYAISSKKFAPILEEVNLDSIIELGRVNAVAFLEKKLVELNNTETETADDETETSNDSSTETTSTEAEAEAEEVATITLHDADGNEYNIPLTIANKYKVAVD